MLAPQRPPAAAARRPRSRSGRCGAPRRRWQEYAAILQVCHTRSCSKRRLDDGRDVEKPDPTRKEGLHRDLVGGVQHGRRSVAAGRAPRAPAPAQGTARHRGARNSADRWPRGRGAGSAPRSDRASRACRRSGCACRARRAGRAPSRRETPPGCARSIRDAPESRSAPAARPNRWCASISSSPLFIMVAESTEILAPMVQLGCAIAWLGVTLAISRQRVPAKRSARGGEEQPLDAVAALAAQGLEDRVVLRIDRQQHGAARPYFIEQERARADQRFLGGQRDHDAASHRGEGRLQPGRADDRRHDPVGRPLGRLDQARRAAGHLDLRAGRGRP